MVVATPGHIINSSYFNRYADRETTVVASCQVARRVPLDVHDRHTSLYLSCTKGVYATLLSIWYFAHTVLGSLTLPGGNVSATSHENIVYVAPRRKTVFLRITR